MLLIINDTICRRFLRKLIHSLSEEHNTDQHHSRQYTQDSHDSQNSQDSHTDKLRSFTHHTGSHYPRLPVSQVNFADLGSKNFPP